MNRGPRRALAGTIVALGLATATAFAQDSILMGTDGNDILTGTPAAESIYGRAGNDAINGAAGDDELDGGPGADVLNGGEGGDVVSYEGPGGVAVSLDRTANDGVTGEGDNVGSDVEDIFGGSGPDRLTGDARSNTIDGRAGEDRITGGRGRDALFGGDGDDVIEARDGVADQVDCGSGQDFATIDRGDRIRSCERTDKPPVTNDLTLLPRRRQLIVGSIDSGSTIVIACVRGCHPALSPSRALLRRTSVRGPVARIRLPSRVTGATLEIGIRAGGDAGCTRFRIGRRFATFRLLTSQRCTTVARARGT